MKEKKLKKAATKVIEKAKDLSQSVKMKFSEDKFYNDPNVPMFQAGKVYDMEGGDWIQRWLKRGGEIVYGEMPLPPSDISSPSIVTNSIADSDKSENIVEETIFPEDEEDFDL